MWLSVDFFLIFFKAFLLLLLQFHWKFLFRSALKLPLPKKLHCSSFICSGEGNYSRLFFKKINVLSETACIIYMAETNHNQSCKNFGLLQKTLISTMMNLLPDSEYGFSLIHIVPYRNLCAYTVKHGSEKTRILTYYVKVLLYAHIQTERHDFKFLLR